MAFDMFVAGRIRFGCGAVSEVGEVAKKTGGKRALLVTDAVLAEMKTAERIEKLLKDAGIQTWVFSDVEPEPSVETTDAAAELAREKGCDLVVGLGGGSSMDVAKAVSVLVTNDGSAARYQGLGLVEKAGVCRIMIPTTAGTGSEVTFTSVLIRKSDGFKGGINDEKLFPDYSILDPELTVTMPPRVTAATGMDALIHALEAYVGRQASPFSDMFAEEALVRIGRWIRVAVKNGRDIEARSEMMLAALYGGIALANAGVGACHALSYPLGAVYGVGHGVGNALLIPYVARYNCQAAPERYADAAELLGYLQDGSDPLFERAELCADVLEELVFDLELPATLEDLDVGITPESLEGLAEKAMAVSRPMENNPREMKAEDCVNIYKEAMA
ncbi:MAG: alcohol dehydrogenase [Synergistales bacterium]|jgi:alcohol dehydrogenase|nr:alcohol dehydrogenase [Synergistales bacterium]